jgi:hypothetical protein
MSGRSFTDVIPLAQDTSCYTSRDVTGSDRSVSPKCRLGGADAGSTVANVNLIQPCQKRKAFNTMIRIDGFIVTPAQGLPLIPARFQSCTIGEIHAWAREPAP